ncbi:MAG: MetQ/NlpA family ABC transporter substrate-binding protein [Pygmaiobacter massiliensis]|nr:MetQ/NlpA family ABC transporter substrate-binding protein [Pygmaiobacter massiliensis]
MKFRTLTAAALAAAMLLAGCSGTASSSQGSSAPQSTSQASSQASQAASGELTVVKVGASPSPHAEMLEQVKPLLAEQGIDLQIVEFDDYVMPNTALEAGDLDANFFQHQPYLDDFNEKNGTHIVSIADVHFEALGVYSDKVTSLEELSDGAVVGIPSDNTNGARALQLLAAQGLIELDPEAGLSATELDVTKNPKNLKFEALEAAQLPASLPDLDIAVINGNYALGAGITDKLLACEDTSSEAAQTYPNVLCVREGDEERPELVALKEALLSDTVKDFIVEAYPGVVIPLF